MSRTEICESPWVKNFKTGKYLHKWKGYETILIGGPYSDNIGIGEEKFSHCIGFFCGIGDVDWWIKEELDKLTKEEKEELEWICKYKTKMSKGIFQNMLRETLEEGTSPKEPTVKELLEEVTKMSKEELTQEELEFIKSELGYRYRFALEENTEKEVELYNSIDRKITKLLNQNKDD